MARKLIIYCEMCGSDTLTCTADFIVFHHLQFCSPDCREDYRSGHEARRERKEQPAVRAWTPKAA
jgi:hypothetical protein